MNPPSGAPAWATGTRTWIDVSISKQTLVAYEGSKPVFATLVSTGIDGTGDPETTHSTVQGKFLIHTKHVTATMDGDEAGDEFDLREVPYVQYFKDGFAFHAAYWHDGFGAPRSPQGERCASAQPWGAARSPPMRAASTCRPSTHAFSSPGPSPTCPRHGTAR